MLKKPFKKGSVDGQEPQHHVTSVEIQAIAVEDVGNGSVRLTFPCKPLAEEDHKVLDRLFPNTREHVGRLLDRELLIQAMETTDGPPGNPTVFISYSGTKHDYRS